MKQKHKTAFLVLLAATTFLLLTARAQVNGPVTPHKVQTAAGSIQIDVDMVLVNASVTDTYGHPVPNLEKKNFRLFEDNIEQEILTFSNEDVRLRSDCSLTPAEAWPIKWTRRARP